MSNMEISNQSNDWQQVNDTLIFQYWFIVILVNICGNIISSTRWCIEANKKSKCGLAMYYIGGTITKLSYGFGPIALLLPLQSLSVIFNALFKSKYTKLDITKSQVFGMIIILISLTITIIFGPRSNSSYYTIDDLLFKFNESSSMFIIFLMSLFVLLNWLIFSIECKYKTDEFYMLTFVHIAAYFGGWNIVFSKCILELISSSLISMELATINWTHWLSYVIVISFILSFIGSQNWRQKAYNKYHTEYVLAIDTFLLVIIGIILGSMLFDEFTYMSLTYVIVYFIGVLLSFVGVGIVSFQTYHHMEGNMMKLEHFNEDWVYQQNIEIIDPKTDKNKNKAHYNVSHPSVEAEEWRNTLSNDKQVNWQIIGQIVMDHAFIDTVEAANLTLDHLEDFFEEEGILADDFRDSLCASYCSIDDEGSVLWQVLFHTLNYSKTQRLLFYDLVLHEYYTLSDITVANLVQILSKMTRDLNVDATEFRKIKEILLNTKLDGHKFELMDCTQFIRLFRSIRSVNESVWCLVYEELMYWAFQEFQGNNEIDWESIGCVLWNNNFCDNQDELNACLDELEVYFQKENLGSTVLREELCVCYGNKRDKGSILRKILLSIMNYSKQKRLQFYEILLHNFMDLESLNSSELIPVLKRSVREVDKNINLNKFESIAKLHQLNGCDLAAIRRSEHFADIFKSLRYIDASVWEKIYDTEMMKWHKFTPTEYEFSVSRLKTPSFRMMKNRIKSPTNKKEYNSYIEIPNDDADSNTNEDIDSNDNDDEDQGSEIANALIDILEDVALSNEPYVPSKRVLSESRSRSKHKSNKLKRRRPSTASQVFPRRERRRTNSKDSSASNGSRINLHHVDKYLKYVIQAAHHFKEKRLLSYVIDSYDLMRFKTLNNTPINPHFDLSTFVQNNCYFKQVEDYIIHKHNLQNECEKTGDFMCKTFDEYYILFGHEISFSPSIKIMDSMGAFMSYTFSMTNAIKTYMNPSPQMCPLIVDLWIIPNKTVAVNGSTTIINSIGDIKQRLQCNKLRYIKKCCSSTDIVQTTYNIQECLCSANIRHGLKHKNVNRIVFIIDRRYQETDYLYCFIPPSKYAKIANEESTFHINHTNHTSRYLLPSTSQNNNDSIGASDNCNGYMFALSFVIYESKRNSFNCKIYFYSQGAKLRFLPKQIGILWPKYFGNDDDKTNKYDVNKIVNAMFYLNLEDPYFAKHNDLQKEFVLTIEENDKEECAQQLKEWSLFNKTLCQNTVINENEFVSKQQSSSTMTTSTETTPTAEVAALSNRFSNHNHEFDVFVEQQKEEMETVIL